jgi:hypothetical protein
MAVMREAGLAACGAVLVAASGVLMVLGSPASQGAFVAAVGIGLCASSQVVLRRAWVRAVVFLVVGVAFVGFRLGALVTDAVTSQHVIVVLVQIVIVVAVCALGYEHAHGLSHLAALLTRPNPGYAPVLDEMSAARAVETELARSRRHGAPLTLLLLEPASDPVAPVFRTVVDRIATPALAQLERIYARERACELIAAHVRRSDFVVCSEDRFLVMSADTSADGTRILAERMIAAVQDELGLALRTGLAAFPVHGSTYSELVAVARAHANANADTTTAVGSTELRSPAAPRAEANQ